MLAELVKGGKLPPVDQRLPKNPMVMVGYEGIGKHGGIHTLRHCWATHLLESGVDLFTLQQWMGHREIGTTTRYLRLARPGATVRGDAPLSLLAALPRPGAAEAAAAQPQPST